jgi:hypothetical protein
VESGIWVSVGALIRNPVSVAVKTFPHLIFFIKTFYNSFKSRYHFETQCCNKLYYSPTQKGFIPLKFDEPYYASSYTSHTHKHTILNNIISVIVQSVFYSSNKARRINPVTHPSVSLLHV